MGRRPVAWLRAQFVEPQRWRDVDADNWWQMPHDPTRVASPWLQLAVDLVTRSTFSQWHQSVAEERVRHYDELRPSVARGAFLVGVAVALAVLAAPLWCWLLLLPATAQVCLELALHRYLQEGAPDPRLRFLRWARDMVDEHYRTALFNVSGMIGVVACPAIVVAICLAPPGGQEGWIKVVALASATMYVNSGLASAFLDPPNYRETSLMPPVMHWVRPYAAVVSLAVVVAVVWVTVSAELWEPSMIPLAYAASTLTLLLGSKIRDHDRVVAAAAPVARKAVEAGRKELGEIVHDDMGPIKQAVESASRLDGLPLRDRIDLLTMSAILTHFGTRAGLFAPPLFDLRSVVKKVGSPYGLAGRATTFDIRWDASTMIREHNRTAIRMATALIHNVGQALHTEAHLGAPKYIVVEAYTTGSDRDLRYHLAVRDHLPLIDAERWCAHGTNLAGLRDWLRESFNGDLTQADVGDGTKRVMATWADRPPTRGYSGPRKGTT